MSEQIQPIDFYRNVSIVNGKIKLSTEIVEGYKYAFYLWFGEQVERVAYTNANSCSFSFDILPGKYKAEFFYQDSSGNKTLQAVEFEINDRLKIINNSSSQVERVKRILKLPLTKQKELASISKRNQEPYPGKKLNILVLDLPDINGSNIFLYIGIDDFSREIFIEIFSTKTYTMIMKFINSISAESSYVIESIILRAKVASKGIAKLISNCRANNIKTDLLTSVYSADYELLKENTTKLIRDWLKGVEYESMEQLRYQIVTFVNVYNTLDQQKVIRMLTPHQKLKLYFDM
ncbi:hypothetical protein AB9G26_08885 [Francisella philomiragia]|uniref:hypothetical protein n=1 Tax=Francisella philomiragia TaxID=28110 RepID=UPI00351264E6